MPRKRTPEPSIEDAEQEIPAIDPDLELDLEAASEQLPQLFIVPEGASGERLDTYLTQQLDGVSRSRVQMLLDQHGVLLDGKPAKASFKLRGGESVSVTATPQLPPLHAIAEDIPLDIVFEDDDLAVINKPAGMMVHAGSGATDEARNRGTLVNAALHHFQSLSSTGGDLRPGIVHRLDKQTSGMIIVAKNDAAHLRLSEMFASRRMRKTYVALVHGWIERDTGTINEPISRDTVRRTRMTTRRTVEGRTAISHYKVLRRIDSRFGHFTLAAVKIETGRTHQIRVHMSSIGHPVVGDTLYGAPAEIALASGTVTRRSRARALSEERTVLARNFLHAAELEFEHPRTGKTLQLSSPLPQELEQFLANLERQRLAGE